MKKFKVFAACLAAAFAAAAVAACGCGGEEAFLADYPLDDVTITEQDSPVVVAGLAGFTAMSVESGGYSLGYRLYVPEEEQKMPLLIFFHGAGERGSDNAAQLSYEGLETLLGEDSGLLESMIIAPQCPLGEMWVNFSSADTQTYVDGNYSVSETAETQAMATVLKLVRYYTENYNVDKNRIYVMGMSMGGYATWDVLMRHTEIVAAAVPICGGADTSQAEKLVDKPVYTFHGTLDPLVSVEGTRAMVKALQDAGSTKVIYEEIAEGYHDIWNGVLSRSDVREWLLAQSL